MVALAALLALGACGDGDDGDGSVDGDVDVDSCLEEATTPDERELCSTAEALDDSELDIDGFTECVDQLDNDATRSESEECVDVLEDEPTGP